MKKQVDLTQMEALPVMESNISADCRMFYSFLVCLCTVSTVKSIHTHHLLHFQCAFYYRYILYFGPFSHTCDVVLCVCRHYVHTFISRFAVCVPRVSLLALYVHVSCMYVSLCHSCTLFYALFCVHMLFAMLCTHSCKSVSLLDSIFLVNMLFAMLCTHSRLHAWTTASPTSSWCGLGPSAPTVC